MLHLVSDDPRYRGHVALSLDGRAPVRGQVATSLSRLNLAPAASLGHAPALPHLPGLQGCVRGLVVSRYIYTSIISMLSTYLHRTRISLLSPADPLVTSRHGLGSCAAHPCSGLPCSHEAECVSVWPPSRPRHLCHCAPGYTGRR